MSIPYVKYHVLSYFLNLVVEYRDIQRTFKNILCCFLRRVDTLVQTFGLSLRGVENAIATPVSTFSPSFSTLHIVLLLTRVTSATLFCTFERGFVIPTSDCDTHLRLWYSPKIVIPTSDCDTHLRLWYPPQTVIPTSDCDTHLRLWYPPQIVIPTSDCDTHLRFSFHELVHIINYFTLTIPFYPHLPAF